MTVEDFHPLPLPPRRRERTFTELLAAELLGLVSVVALILGSALGVGLAGMAGAWFALHFLF